MKPPIPSKAIILRTAQEVGWLVLAIAIALPWVLWSWIHAIGESASAVYPHMVSSTNPVLDTLAFPVLATLSLHPYSDMITITLPFLLAGSTLYGLLHLLRWFVGRIVRAA